MPKKINWDSIRQDFLSEHDLTYTALAARHGVSRQAVEKRASDEGWQALRQSLRREQSMAVEEAERNDEFDLDNLLKRAIVLSFNQLENSEVRSFEGAAESVCKLAEVYCKLHPPRPPSVGQWVDKALEFGLPADEFFRQLRLHFNLDT